MYLWEAFLSDTEVRLDRVRGAYGEVTRGPFDDLDPLNRDACLAMSYGVAKCLVCTCYLWRVPQTRPSILRSYLKMVLVLRRHP